MPSSLPNGDNTEKLPSQNLSSYTSQMLSIENTGISSVETLLTNIQGLLKVAAENARHRERQINFEKGMFDNLYQPYFDHDLHSS